jgi:hypothetical protein
MRRVYIAIGRLSMCVCFETRMGGCVPRCTLQGEVLVRCKRLFLPTDPFSCGQSWQAGLDIYCCWELVTGNMAEDENAAQE